MGALKEEYNQLLEKFWKAYAYMEDQSISIYERKRWIPEFAKLTKHLGTILLEIRKRGINPTKEQILKGF
jgi:hypothetical protein